MRDSRVSQTDTHRKDFPGYDGTSRFKLFSHICERRVQYSLLESSQKKYIYFIRAQEAYRESRRVIHPS